MKNVEDFIKKSVADIANGLKKAKESIANENLGYEITYPSTVNVRIDMAVQDLMSSARMMTEGSGDSLVGGVCPETFIEHRFQFDVALIMKDSKND